MVSIDRDYSRVMLFDPSGPSRHRITKQLTAPPSQPELINPYLTSIDDKTSGPYYFQVETISASNTRNLHELPDFKLPGVIVLCLDKKNVGTFVSVSTQLLDANISQRCPVVCVVGEADLKFHQKLQRTIAVAERNGLTCAISWDSEHPELDATAGLMGLSARLKRVVHRTMCADIAFNQSTTLERRDNKNVSTSKNLSTSSLSGAETAVGSGSSATTHSLAKLFTAPPTSPIKKSRPLCRSQSLFNFDRAGKTMKIEKQKKQDKKEKQNRFHRKHSLCSDDLNKFLGKATLSTKMKARLKGITEATKEKLKNKPVVGIFRDVLQPDFIQTQLPLQRVSKSDVLTWNGFEMLYDVHLQNYKASIYNFTIALQDDEHHFYARFYRGLAYAAVGRFRKSLLDIKKCLLLVEKDGVDMSCPGTDSKSRLMYICNFNLALLHLNTHDHDVAVKRLTTCAHVDPFSPETAALRGFIRRRRGNYAECRSDYVIHSKLKLRQELGASAAALIEHSYSSTEEKKIADFYHRVVRSPKKKSQILSFLTSTQKSLIAIGPDRNEMHLQYIAALLTSQMWFKKLSSENQMKIAASVEYSTLETGEWICRRGDYADSFYVIMSGSVNVMVTDLGMASETHGGTLSTHDNFGELSLLNSTDRTASLCASEACELLTFSLHCFNACGIREALAHVHLDKREALVMSNVFNGLPSSFLNDATDFATIRIYEQGDVLIRQGQHSESLFIMLQGVCDVWQKVDIREELVHRKKVLIDQLESTKMNYVYHHQVMYHPTARVGEETNVNDSTLIEDKMARFESELQILTAQIQEIDRQKMNHYRRNSKWKKLVPSLKKKKKKSAMKKIRLAEIMAPSFFGEASLRADGSLEHAEVVASTRVVMLRIFMSQMDFSKVNDTFLGRLANLSSVKPLSLEKLSARAHGERGWLEYRNTLMTFVNKIKWPVRNGIVTAGACGTSVIHVLPKPNGVL